MGKTAALQQAARPLSAPIQLSSAQDEAHISHITSYAIQDLQYTYFGLQCLHKTMTCRSKRLRPRLHDVHLLAHEGALHILGSPKLLLKTGASLRER